MGELYNPFPKLPKNIRQIGERDETVRLYVEDYVNTYLKRLYPTGGQDLRVGLLLGSAEEQEGTPYVFVDGAMEMEGVTAEGEQVSFSEEAWKKAYQNIEEQFPKRTVQGWFLCGAPGCSLSPLNYWKQHLQYFSGKNQIMYLNGGLEGEEAIYITSSDGFYKLRGHCIYYERNQMMQDYMVNQKENRKVEAGGSDPVIRDFRQKMESKKAQISVQKNSVSLLGGLCSALAIVVLAGGVVMFNNYEKMRDMEGVIASVLPVGAEGWEDGRQNQSKIQVEEVPGEVFPTEADAEEASLVGSTLVEDGNPGTEPGGDQESGIQETGGAAADRQETGTPPDLTGADAGAETETDSAVAAGGPVLQKVTEPGPGQMYYTVQDGETLYGICFKLYQSVNHLDEICQLNGLTDQNHIMSGQKLVVPESSVPQEAAEN